jgi:catechol 2,3-dioxygenase-like lactoylglutathione lyase family enzyme
MQDKLRLEGLTLTVESVSRSVDFYSGILGLEVGYVSEPAFAMIKVGGGLAGSIGLLSVEEARKEGAEESTRAQKRAIHVEFTTDEPWERVMTGFDPDGYSVEIAQGRRGEDGTMWNKDKQT